MPWQGKERQHHAVRQFWEEQLEVESSYPMTLPCPGKALCLQNIGVRTGLSVHTPGLI